MVMKVTVLPRTTLLSTMITNTSTSENNNYSMTPPSFNGDVSHFSWWKCKMYAHIIGVDDQLWDIIEDGVEFEVDTKGILLDIKSLTDDQRKNY